MSESLAIFFQIGQADEETNQISDYYGGGLVYSHFLTEGDAIGFAIAKVKNGDAFMNMNAGVLHSETAIELSYNRPWSEIISSQFSIYHIKNPDMDSSLDDALAAGLRLVIAF